MRPNFRVLACLVALSAAVCVSSVSFAQTPAPAAAHEQWAASMREHAKARAKALHDILNLRPDQEAALQAFLASMKPPEGADGLRERDEKEPIARLTTPERLDRIAARMAEGQAEFQRRAEAVKRFYGALSPEQQRAFDALHGL
jgi:Spy/CpxP family protein refolding chaperone